MLIVVEQVASLISRGIIHSELPSLFFLCLRSRQSMAVAACRPRPPSPRPAPSTFPSVLATLTQPPMPPVQSQTHPTPSTAQTPLFPASAVRCRTTACLLTEAGEEPRSSSTTSAPAGEEQPGQGRKGDRDQGTRALPGSRTHLPTCLL